jgi:phospholipid/cholesterol/gamma-HCH transport system substrate-binding protein|tara:strand:- start:461 stop:901 length:441 start_codon:yes stop_codon:yes gene_type:complete
MKSDIFEFIVGLGVIIIAGWFILSVVSKSDKLSNISETTNYIASFNDVSGISVGSNIKLAGVTVGKVLELKLDEINYTAEMVLGINRKIKIPNDSEIIITSEGLLGGNYVSISPGGSDIFLKANEKFSFTQSSLSLNNLIQKFFGK